MNIKAREKFRVVIFIYPGFTLLDAIGPNEILGNSDFLDVTFVSTKQHCLSNDLESFEISGVKNILEVDSADVLLVPGGPGDHAILNQVEVLEWIRKIDKTTQLTTSVCSGSLILAKSGLLTGRKACCHWSLLDELSELGAIPVKRRVIKSDKYITASGVSSGIDMALYLVECLINKSHARELRFGIEYFPSQLNILSTYTIPIVLLKPIAKIVKEIIKKSRKKYLMQ